MANNKRPVKLQMNHHHQQQQQVVPRRPPSTNNTTTGTKTRTVVKLPPRSLSGPENHSVSSVKAPGSVKSSILKRIAMPPEAKAPQVKFADSHLTKKASHVSQPASEDSTGISEISDLPLDAHEARRAANEASLLSFLDKLSAKLETMDTRITRLDTELNLKMKSLEEQALCKSATKPATAAGPGDENQERNLLGQIDGRIIRVDNRVELLTNQLFNKVDARSDETQTMLTEVLEKLEQTDGTQEKSKPSMDPKTISAEIVQIVAKVTESTFEKIRASFTEELTSQFSPMAQKFLSDAKNLQQEFSSVLQKIIECSNNNAREADVSRDAIVTKLFRIRDEILHQQSTAQDRNTEILKQLQMQHFQDTENQLRHHRQCIDEVYAKVNGRLDRIEELNAHSDLALKRLHDRCISFQSLASRRSYSETVPASLVATMCAANAAAAAGGDCHDIGVHGFRQQPPPNDVIDNLQQQQRQRHTSSLMSDEQVPFPASATFPVSVSHADAFKTNGGGGSGGRRGPGSVASSTATTSERSGRQQQQSRAPAARHEPRHRGAAQDAVRRTLRWAQVRLLSDAAGTPEQTAASDRDLWAVGTGSSDTPRNYESEQKKILVASGEKQQQSAQTVRKAESSRR